MAPSHVVEVPKAIWIVKLVQLVISVIVLGCDAYLVYIVDGLSSTLDYIIFVGVFSILIGIYYFVALHGATVIYNWIAVLVLECLALVFWLAAWAVMTQGYVNLRAFWCVYYYSCARASELISEDSEAQTSVAMCLVIIVLGVINFVLYCVSLGFFARGIHVHRKAGNPMTSGVGTDSNAKSWPELGRNEMQDYQGATPQPNGFQYVPQQQVFSQQQQYQQPAIAPSQQSYYDSHMSPVSANSQPVPRPNTYGPYSRSSQTSQYQ